MTPDTSPPPHGQTNGNGRAHWRSPKDVVVAIKEVGIPGAIAIFLVYMGATEIPKIARGLERVIIEIHATQTLIREHIVKQTELERITRQACRNAARDENARRYCD